MNKQKIAIIFLLAIVLTFFTSNRILAYNSRNVVANMEYSQEYLDWLALDEEIREKSIMPRMYNVYSSDIESANPVKFARLLGSTVQTRFNLK